jgi:hypothetical protein
LTESGKRTYVVKSPFQANFNEFAVVARNLPVGNTPRIFGLVVRKGRSRQAKLQRNNPPDPQHI